MPAYELGSDVIEIQTDSATLGEGFNSINLNRRPQASLFSPKTIAESLEHFTTATPEIKLKLEVCETAHELATKLDMHAEVAAKYMGGSVKGSADFMDEKSFSDNSFVFVFHGKSVSRRVSLKTNPSLLADTMNKLRKPEKILREFGDYYCSELIYGGELILFVTITANTREEKRAAAASLQASYSAPLGTFSGSVAASLKTSFTEKTKNLKTKCDLYQVGAISAPKDMDFATFIEYALNYFNEQDHSNNLMRAVYRPITQLSLPAYVIGQDDLMENLQKALDPVWEKRDKYLRWLGDYQQARHLYDEAFVPDSDYYLPTGYYNVIRNDIDHRIECIIEEIHRNGGNIDLCDPVQVIQQGTPDDFTKKLEKRKIKSTTIWGGSGGAEFRDNPKNLQGITHITLTKTNGYGVAIGKIVTRMLYKDGSTLESVHGKRDEGQMSIALNQGDHIEGIEVRADSFVHQVTLWVRRKGEPELQVFGPFPEVPDPSANWPNSAPNKKMNIILLSVIGRSGDIPDALGVNYIDL